MRKALRLSVLAFVVILAFASCSQDLNISVSTPAIRGSISIPAGANVAGSDFYVRTMFGDDVVRTDKANSDGSFVIYGLEEGKDYNVMLTTVDPDASRDVSRAVTGYGGWLKNVTASINEQNNVGSVPVKPLGTIRGVVKRDGASDGYDTRVFIPGTSYSADTDEFGNYTISNVPQSYSPYKLRFTASGYSPKMIDVRLYSTNDDESPEITAPTTTLYVNVGSLQGTAKLGSAPDSTGITVKLENANRSMVGSTNSDGSFSIYDIKPGIYNVTVSYPGYLSQTIANVTILESRNTTIPTTIILQKASGTVSGTISIAGETDLSGVVVTVMGNGRSFSSETDSEGFYSVAVAEGNYDTISFTGSSCVAQKWISQQIALFANNNITLEPVTLESGHNWGVPEIIKSATCTEAGSQKVICKTCGAEVIQDIDKRSHNWIENGHHDGKIEYVCSLCGETKYTEDSTVDPITDEPIEDSIVNPNELKIQRIVFDSTARPADYVSDGMNVWEEYYTVDLSNLTENEKKRMTLEPWWTRNGDNQTERMDWEFLSVETHTGLNTHTGLMTFNLSGNNSVILHFKFSVSGSTDTILNLILKPTVLVSTNSSVVPINDFYETLQIDTSNAVSGKEYVLVIKPDNTVDGSIGLSTWSSVNTRFLNGNDRGPTQKIETNENNATAVYLGKIERNNDFLITFPIHNSSEEPHHYADVYIREISNYEATKMAESRVVIKGSGDTVYTVDVPARTVLQKSLNVVPAEGTQANNLFITTECNYLNSDGTLGDYYGLGSVSNSLDGWSTDGTYSVFQKSTLSSMSLFANNITDGLLRITLTIHKSNNPITPWTNNPDSNTVTIIPNNGDDFYTIVVPTDTPYGSGSFEAPVAPVRDGYRFVQWARQGWTYQPGDTVTVGFDDTMVGVWEYTGEFTNSYPYLQVDNAGVLTLKNGVSVPEEVEIPLVLNGKTVKTIGENAFKDCKTIKKITVPKGIQEFGYYAFKGCDNLETIVFTGTSSEWKEIEKPEYWLYDVRFKTLICSDRIINLEVISDTLVDVNYSWITDTTSFSVEMHAWWSRPLEDYGIIVHYTTDGTVPSTNSPVYSGPLTIEEGSILKYLIVSVYDESVATNQIQLPIVPTFTRGPAGGWIVYDKGEYSDGWRYLEIAPYDLEVVDGVPTLKDNSSYFLEGFIMGYCKDPDSGEVVLCGTESGIGTGYENTQKLYAAMGDAAFVSLDSDETTDQYAARLVSILEYNGFDDWFIPSRDEWECVRHAIGIYGIGNLSNGENPNWSITYWGSTEYPYSNGGVGFPTVEPTKSYDQGSGGNAYFHFRVRPMRRY